MTQGAGTPFERGRGTIRTIVGTDPAADVEISETVPAGVIWVLHAASFVLVADANAANRQVVIVLDDGTDNFWIMGANVTQIASQTRRYMLGNVGIIGQTSAVTLDTLVIPVPLVPLAAGYRIRTATTAMQAGDDYGAPVLLVEEWTL